MPRLLLLGNHLVVSTLIIRLRKYLLKYFGLCLETSISQSKAVGSVLLMIRNGLLISPTPSLYYRLPCRCPLQLVTQYRQYTLNTLRVNSLAVGVSQHREVIARCAFTTGSSTCLLYTKAKPGIPLSASV